MRTLAPMTMMPLDTLDHHHRGTVGLDAEVLQRGERFDRIEATEIQRDGARIGYLGDRAEQLVDRDGHAARSGEVRVAQAEAQAAHLVETEAHLALHSRTVGDARGGGNTAGDRARGTPRAAIAPVASAPWATA